MDVGFNKDNSVKANDGSECSEEDINSVSVKKEIQDTTIAVICLAKISVAARHIDLSYIQFLISLLKKIRDLTMSEKVDDVSAVTQSVETDCVTAETKSVEDRLKDATKAALYLLRFIVTDKKIYFSYVHVLISSLETIRDLTTHKLLLHTLLKQIAQQ